MSVNHTTSSCPEPLLQQFYDLIGDSGFESAENLAPNPKSFPAEVLDQLNSDAADMAADIHPWNEDSVYPELSRYFRACLSDWLYLFI